MDGGIGDLVPPFRFILDPMVLNVDVYRNTVVPTDTFRLSDIPQI